MVLNALSLRYSGYYKSHGQTKPQRQREFQSRTNALSHIADDGQKLNTVSWLASPYFTGYRFEG